MSEIEKPCPWNVTPSKMRCLVANVRRIERGRKARNWSVLMEALGVGRTTARLICAWADIDPDATDTMTTFPAEHRAAQ